MWISMLWFGVYVIYIFKKIIEVKYSIREIFFYLFFLFYSSFYNIKWFCTLIKSLFEKDTAEYKILNRKKFRKKDWYMKINFFWVCTQKNYKRFSIF